MKKQLDKTFEDIISLENLFLAWREFLAGKKKKKDVQEFSRNLADNILTLHEDLENKIYPDNEIATSRPSPPLTPPRGGGEMGLPLGNLTSQLFANVYMDVFDQWVKRNLRIKNYLRYADDFVFLSEDRERLLKIIPRVEKFLDEKLKLMLHPKKIIFKTVASGVDFLGWINFTRHRILRRTTRQRIFRRVRDHAPETLQSYL